jgi:hypothetical protein
MAWFDKPLVPEEGTKMRTSQSESRLPDGEAVCHAFAAHPVLNDRTGVEGRECRLPNGQIGTGGTRNRAGFFLLAILRALSAWSV